MIKVWVQNTTYQTSSVYFCLFSAPSKPQIFVPSLVERQRKMLMCWAPSSCFYEAHVQWYWIMNDGKSTELAVDRLGSFHRRVLFYPTAEHHNTNITCSAQYEHDAVETTVTLTVKCM